MSHARSATPIGAATIRIYNELLPSKFTGDLKAAGRTTQVDCNGTRSASKTLPKFNLAPAGADIRNSWPSQEFLGKLIFSRCCSDRRSGIREKAHGLD